LCRGGVVAHDERARGELDAIGRERLLRNLHRHVLQLVTERDHVVRAGVRDRDAGRACAGETSLRHGRRHRRDLRLQDRRIGHRHHVHVERVAHRPAAVVVRLQARVGIVLLLEQVLREAAIRLVALDHVRTRGIRLVAHLHGLVGHTDFDALDAQHVHHFGGARHVALHRDDVAVRRLRLAVLDGIARLDVEVLEDGGREHRRELQRRDDAGFHVVRIRAPRERGHVLGGVLNAAIPLTILATTTARRHATARGEPARRATGAGRTTTSTGARTTGPAGTTSRRRCHGFDITARLRLVHLHETVVVVRDGAEIARRPAVHERVRVHPGHAVLRHLRELEVREPRQLGEQDRIEIRILWRTPAVRVEQRLRFMQVVHDRRVRREVPIDDAAHLQQRDVDVAVVVVVHVLAPVRQ
jgi:hypothetical protein